MALRYYILSSVFIRCTHTPLLKALHQHIQNPGGQKHKNDLSVPKKSLQLFHNLHKIPNHILHILICQPRVKRQRHLVHKEVVGVREVGDVEAKGFVGGHHGEGLVVDIAGDAALGHLDDYFAPFRIGPSEQPYNVQMSAAGEILTIMIQNDYWQVS